MAYIAARTWSSDGLYRRGVRMLCADLYSREEMEVLFVLLAQRYERGSVMLTSNLPFSKWEPSTALCICLSPNGGHRPPCASQRHLGVESAELSAGGLEAAEKCLTSITGNRPALPPYGRPDSSYVI